MLKLRAWCLLVIGLLIALAFFSRSHPVGNYAWDKSLGDVLWASMIYVVVLVVLPRWRPGWIWMVASVGCVGMEIFKLTGLPMAWRASAVSRILFGTTPSWHNVICYLIGTTAAFVVYALVARIRVRAARHSKAVTHV